MSHQQIDRDGSDPEIVFVHTGLIQKAMENMRRSREDFQSLLEQAELGDASVQYDLGARYAAGDGVAEDPAQAALWFAQAAESGDLRAVEALGGDGAVIASPNNILGVEYCKALLRQESRMMPMPLRRDGDYHAAEPDPSQPSATSLRALPDFSAYVPEETRGCYAGAPRYRLAFGERAMLARLRAPNALREEVTELIRRHDTPLPGIPEANLRRLLRRLGEARLRRLIALQRADNLAQAPEYRAERAAGLDEVLRRLDAILREDACFSLRQLAVNGRDLLALGLRGAEIGRALLEDRNGVITGYGLIRRLDGQPIQSLHEAPEQNGMEMI